MPVTLLYSYVTADQVRNQAHEVETKDYSDDEIKEKINNWALKAHGAAGLSSEITSSDPRYGFVVSYILYGVALEILASFPDQSNTISSIRPIWEEASEFLQKRGTGRAFGKTLGINNQT